MPGIRTFVAVLLTEALKNNIASVQDDFRKLAPDFKWVEPDNFHVTLKFLGDVEEDRLDDVFSAVQRAVSDIQPFDLMLGGAGAFPNPRRPRIVWVGVENGEPELKELARRVESELVSQGFPKEEKGFKAHITIGRAKEGRSTPDLSSAAQDGGAEPLGSLVVEKVAVMKSDLRPKGPVYTPLREFDLAGGGGRGS